MARFKNFIRVSAALLLLLASTPVKRSEAIPIIDFCLVGCTLATAYECMPRYNDVIACSIYQASCIFSCKAFS